MESHITDITRVIQLAVAPVFLLTAIGTLIAVLNVRLGRNVDRRRLMEEELRGSPENKQTDEQRALRRELRLLARRIRLIYFAMLSAGLGALLVCLVVAGAFVGRAGRGRHLARSRCPVHSGDVRGDRLPRHVPARSLSGRAPRARHKIPLARLPDFRGLRGNRCPHDLIEARSASASTRAAIAATSALKSASRVASTPSSASSCT